MSGVMSSCENPQFPTWTWRYNRDKHLSRFQPWYTRVDQWPPRYRHMGMPYNFQFHPLTAEDVEGGVVPFQQLGVSYAKHLSEGRETGFGNAALGNPPGPAPPRLGLYSTEAPYPVGELYRVNEIAGISGGMSLWDYSKLTPDPVGSSVPPPLDPREYLKATLGQEIEYPGTFPHFNAPPRPSSHCPPRVCQAKDQGPRDPLSDWRDRHRHHLRGHALERLRVQRNLPPLESGAVRMSSQSMNCSTRRPATTGPCEASHRKIY